MNQLFSNTASVATRSKGIVNIRNTEQDYGVFAIFLHWLVAFVVLGMFTLGVWMTGLTYYDEWYKLGPDIHRSIGILLLFVMLVRVIWRILNVKPKDEPQVSSLQRRVAHGVHLMLYGLIFAMIISGYLISTADGRPIEVFGLFSVPATITGVANMEDIAGKVHWYLALLLISLAALHTMAALKHHFIDRDRTLKKMLGVRTQFKTKFHQPKENKQ